MITAADIQMIRDADPGAVLPGIDTMTGNPYATSSLLDVTKISQNTKAPYYYSPSANIVYVTQAGAVLSGINFGSATVYLEANNVTIKDCTFSDTTGFWGVSQPSGVSGATIENCTFTGSKSPTEKNDVWISSVLGITIEDNTFLNSPSDTIAIQHGQGANILTYLALGDGGDIASAFDPAKDVIDLSRIDADILTPGVQNFTFIGSAPFSGGAQVRYQVNPTNDTTTVQAALAGDITADFSITLDGLVPLTAANFALTSSQSTAALANGAALTYTQVTTAAGAPTEYAYSNVQGRAYTSYESFYGSGYENLEADDLNLSSNANKLVLYDPSQTVTRGGGSETLQVGTGSDPLTYHAVETIDATTSTGEQFIFSAGFGKETINGYNASGASPDSIQLAKSAFSYLTAGMTQAEDLAAVMSQATRTSSGLTIHDTHGDSLTLTGVTPSMIAVNPAMLQFT
jgi:hypothetical protein